MGGVCGDGQQFRFACNRPPQCKPVLGTGEMTVCAVEQGGEFVGRPRAVRHKGGAVQGGQRVRGHWITCGGASRAGAASGART